MMASIKELSKQEEKFTGGHRACAGCGAATIMRQTMMAAGNRPVVVGSATGCMEVVSTLFPYTAWKVPFIHNAFENSAATISGVEAAFQSLKRQGKIDKDIKFIALGGDGGTYDIGFQSLSGAMERGHDMVYICYDNQAYMNTGVQRSSATPRGASTTTAPAGRVKQGKEQFRKDIAWAMVAHRIPYVAQSALGFWNDYITKVQKALDMPGPAFINVLAPCRLGWPHDPAKTLDLGRAAANTCFWPLYEVINGKYKINYRPKEKLPITEWLKLQRRFKHLFRPENKHIIDDIQRESDARWEHLQKLEQAFGN
ncbi:MAG: thiamine pyrophosphate-dependent enzyme [bacterium]